MPRRFEGLGQIGNFEEVAPTLFSEMTDAEPSKAVRDRAWEVFRKTLQFAQNNEVLTHYVQQFAEQPERQIFVLEALNVKLQRDAQKEQNPNERAKLLLNLASEQGYAGDVYMKLNQPKAAASKYQQALEQLEPRDQPANANMVTLTLVRKLMTALLAAKDFEGATRFAHEETARNPATLRDISSYIFNEADRLRKDGHPEEALQLINSAQSIKDPELVQLDLLQQIKDDIEKGRIQNRPQ